LDLPCPKQVQILISIYIHDKFQLSPTFALVGFQKDIQQFISQGETNLKCKGLIALLAIIHSDNVQYNVKRTLDFDESKSISKNLLKINFLYGLSIVIFSIQIFDICGNFLYQNFGLNSMHYIIIFIVFF